MQTVCQLDEFHLTKLHLDFHPPETTEVQVNKASLTFDYTVASHRTDKHRYRMTLSIACKAIGPDNKNVGDSIEASIDGFFSFDEAEETDKREALVRLNGVSILYSTLRGIVSTATGVFPGGKFILPTVMPQDVVKMVESNRKRPEPPSAKAKKKALSARKKRTAKAESN